MRAMALSISLSTRWQPPCLRGIRRGLCAAWRETNVLNAVAESVRLACPHPQVGIHFGYAEVLHLGNASIASLATRPDADLGVGRSPERALPLSGHFNDHLAYRWVGSSRYSTSILI